MLSFIRDERGISEEFTSLPALAVVMIGFSLLFIMIAGLYHSYNEEIKSVDEYQTASFILKRITMCDGSLAKEGIMMDGGFINFKNFEKIDEKILNRIRKESGITSKNFALKLEIKEKGFENSLIRGDLPDEYTSVSEYVTVYLNDVKKVPGILSVMVWE